MSIRTLERPPGTLHFGEPLGANVTKVVIRRRLHTIAQVLDSLSTLKPGCAGLHIQMKVNDEEALAYLDRLDEDGVEELALYLYEHAHAFRSPATILQKAQDVLDKLTTPKTAVDTVAT